jgi:hypothetical protein
MDVFSTNLTLLITIFAYGVGIGELLMAYKRIEIRRWVAQSNLLHRSTRALLPSSPHSFPTC